MDIAIIVIYLVAMLGFGFWGKRRASDSAEYLVAGRRLGGPLYMGTTVAVVLGGASTIGGVGLGYVYGLSGMWLVVAIAVGVLVLSLLFAGRIQQLKVYTVTQMMKLRYGIDAMGLTGIVMIAYTLMLTVATTVAYGAMFTVVFDINRVTAIALGAAVVTIYSAMGGMWSITLTDIVQFVIMTVGIFVIFLPFMVNRAGGFEGIRAAGNADTFNLTAIGSTTIVTFFVVYTLGVLIGQDIWQRVFTASTPGVARWGGTAAGVYCAAYGVACALIGAAAAAVLPAIEVPDDVFATAAVEVLPVGISGLVLAAGLAAMMSTSSGALIATANVARQDVVPLIAGLLGKTVRFTGDGHAAAADRETDAADIEADVQGNRLYVIGAGIVTGLLAIIVSDVITGLTIAYDILVGGLLVPILGGLIWRRATGVGALAAMVTGTAATLITMWVVGDVMANEPVYVGVVVAAITFVIASLLTAPTPEPVLAEWNERLSGAESPQTTPAPAADAQN